MSLARVQFFSVSLDGFGTGEGLSLDAPFGHAGDGSTSGCSRPGGGTRWSASPAAAAASTTRSRGCTIRGSAPRSWAPGSSATPGGTRTRSGRAGGVTSPPFHTPVFVLTHQPRPPIEMEGGTTFHFLDASPAEALETAREAADGQDVRIGGGPTMLRDFLAAGLVDHAHIVVVPILLGRGVRLWDGLEGLEKDYQVEAISSPSGVTHVTFTRTAL